MTKIVPFDFRDVLTYLLTQADNVVIGKLPRSVKGGCVESYRGPGLLGRSCKNAKKKIGPFPGSSIRPNLVLIRP